MSWDGTKQTLYLSLSIQVSVSPQRSRLGGRGVCVCPLTAQIPCYSSEVSFGVRLQNRQGNPSHCFIIMDRF